MMRTLPAQCLVILSLLLSMLSGTATADDAFCLECHDEVQDIINSRYFVHKPVREKQCKICHALNQPESTVTQPQQPAATAYVVDYGASSAAETAPPITWLRENFIPTHHQFALINEKELKARLIVELWGAQDGKTTKEFPLPTLETLAAQTPQFQMLSIAGLQLSDFDTRLVPRATLHWTTNEPSRCTTRYGNTDLDVTYDEDDLYTYDHHIDLRNFTSNGYVVEIKCRDPYRRIQTTPQFNILELPVSDTPPPATTATGDQIALRNLQNRLWVAVHSTQNATVSIGVQDAPQGIAEPRQQSTAATETVPSEAQSDQEEHIPLNTRFYTTTKVCYTCHNSLEAGQSHPVNVRPPLNMIIPPEYRLLEDGKISCMTCHSIHGGNTEYRLIKASPKALCTGCHTNY